MFPIGKNGYSEPKKLAISKKKKSVFQEKIEKNANNSKELWKAPESIGMISGTVVLYSNVTGSPLHFSVALTNTISYIMIILKQLEA